VTCHVDTFERHLHVFHLEKLGYVCNKGSHIKDDPRHDELVRAVVASWLAQWNFTTFNFVTFTIYISTFLSQKFIEMVSTKFIVEINTTHTSPPAHATMPTANNAADPGSERPAKRTKTKALTVTSLVSNIVAYIKKPTTEINAPANKQLTANMDSLCQNIVDGLKHKGCALNTEQVRALKETLPSSKDDEGVPLAMDLVDKYNGEFQVVQNQLDAKQAECDKLQKKLHDILHIPSRVAMEEVLEETSYVRKEEMHKRIACELINAAGVHKRPRNDADDA
jgi:hypothetical protein